MDNEFADIEAELKQLRPRGTRADLEIILAETLDANTPLAFPSSRSQAREKQYTTATSWTSWKWANWGVAAALVAMMVAWTSLAPQNETTPIEETMAMTEPPVGEPILRPVRAGRTLLASRIDGLVELADGSSAQRVRDYYVDTIVWRDPEGRSQLKWEVPREAVRFVGLAAY